MAFFNMRELIIYEGEKAIFKKTKSVLRRILSSAESKKWPMLITLFQISVFLLK